MSKLVFRSIDVITAINFHRRSSIFGVLHVLQCFNALKCPKIVKNCPKNVKNYYGAPPPPCLEIAAAAADDLSKKNLFFSTFFTFTFFAILKCPKIVKNCPKIVKNYYGAPPPPAAKLVRLLMLTPGPLFDRSFSSQVLMLTPGPLFD